MLLSLNALLTGKPKIEGRREISPAALFLLLLLLGLGLWLYQLGLMWFWQQDLQHKLAPVKTRQIVPTPKQPEPLLISNLALPALPKLNTGQAARVSAVKRSKPPELTPSKAQAQPVNSEPKEGYPQEKRKQPEPHSARTQTSQRKSAKLNVAAQTVLQQLQTASGLDLQIALPQNVAKRGRLLDYLYRCAGVQFAILQQQQLIYLSPKRYMATSKWLRVVSGGLSAQESTWMGSYPGRPVRLFPQAVDQRLARYIATALQGEPLRALRAQYTLTDSGLALTYIKLNQHVIAGHWLLQQSQCR